jgi:RNA polymerase sigma-70 factor (ECF subfamily)
MSNNLDFEIVYQEYYPKIRDYLVRLIGPFYAEDAAQEVFSKAGKNLGSLKNEEKLSQWLYKIATNTAIDKTRLLSFKNTKNHESCEKNNHLQDKNAWTDERRRPADQRLIKEEMSGCVQEFIHRLPKDFKTVLLLKEYEGKDNKEISRILDVSVNVVKIRYHRAKALLKTELEKGCDFYLDEDNRLQCDRKQPNGIMTKLPT